MNDSDAACRLASTLAEVGRYDDAERIVRAALGQAPEDADLLIMLGYLLRAQDRFRDALAVCDAAVACAPEEGAAHAQRAWTLLGLHRTADAITAATEAVRLDAQLPERELLLAEALADDDRIDEARAAAQSALRLDPGSVDALLTLAAIERQAGNRDAAAKLARRALAVEPTSLRGRRMMALLDADHGVVRRSMRMLAELARERPATPDLDALVWPIRRVVVTPRWWLPGAAGLVAAIGWATPTLAHSAPVARVAAALTCVVTAGFVVRALAPAGRLPWRTLRLSPPLVRHSLRAGLAVIAVVLGLLAGYAAGGPLVLPLLAVTAAPALWACKLSERLGQGLDQAGSREFLQDWQVEVGAVLSELRRWPAETRSSLHAAWHANDDAEAEQKRRTAARRRPLAVYQNRLRNTVLCGAFAVATALAAIVAVASRPATAATTGFGLFALLMLYTSVRVVKMKAIATAEGLVLDGPWWKAIVRWDRVAAIVADSEHRHGAVIPVRAPMLILTDGRRYIVRQAAAYEVATRRAGHHAGPPIDQIAAELDVLRLTYGPRSDTAKLRSSGATDPTSAGSL